MIKKKIKEFEIKLKTYLDLAHRDLFLLRRVFFFFLNINIININKIEEKLQV